MGVHLTKRELQKVLDSSSTFVEVLEKVNKNPKSASGTGKRYLKKHMEEIGCSFEQFDANHKLYKKNLCETLTIRNRHPNPFSYGCGLQNKSMRKYMLEAGFEYKCEKCGNDGKWQDEELVLQVDHTNGDNKDNRKENLRFLCPNCHSQTDTWGTKIKDKYVCPGCKKTYKGHGELCRSCSSIRNNPKKFDPSKKELEQAISNEKGNMVAVGKKFGVSDNSIRKRCRKLGIDWKYLN